MTDNFYSTYFQGAIDLMFPVLPYIFLVFMAVSYECFYDIKRHRLEELVYIGRSHRFRILLCDFGLLLILNIITSGMIYLYQIWFYAQRGIHNRHLQFYTLRVILIYVFLPALLAIMIGWAVSGIRNRLYGLSAILLSFYIFDSSFLSLMLSISKNNYSIWKFGTLFSLFFQSGCGTLRDAYYLLTAENVHIYRVLFFVFLLAACVVWQCGRRIIFALLPLGISLAMLVLFFKPSGAVYNFGLMNTFDSVLHDQYYYETEEQLLLDDTRTEENRKDFQVSAYNMDLCMTDTLHFSVTLTPSRGDLAEYQFTLYHLYQVEKVQDDRGDDLPFDRESDYLLIQNPSGTLASITIKYSGNSQYFYATSQGMILPANFEYIPIAGWHKVFLTNHDLVSGSFFSRELLPEKTKFDLEFKLKGSYPIYSNLAVKEVGKQNGYYRWKIQGTSDGMTLIGSPYLEQKEIAGVRVVYSVLDETNGPVGENLSLYENLFTELEDIGHSMRGKTFIVSPEDNNGNNCFGKDHILDVELGREGIIEYYQDGILYPPLTPEGGMSLGEWMEWEAREREKEEGHQNEIDSDSENERVSEEETSEISETGTESE
ncbi:MAG: hypothetical protein K2J67_04410 [Lachnospiraceae bacterium]|nr:hypothetical protein [Lachnospiraceae bacterium]